MRKILAFLSCLLLVCMHLYPQLPARANRTTFRLYSPSLADGTDVFICGSIPQLSGWDPAKLKMTSTGNHLWSYTIACDCNYQIEYKYTLGSWEREGADSEGNPLSNFRKWIKTDTVVTDTVVGWTDKKVRIIKGGIKGKLLYHRHLKDSLLKERDIVVWLPPDYDQNVKERYPVLYMHDGQNIFDPATSAFGTDWQVDETCDSLIRNKVIGPVIVVGIYNTADRMKEYIPGSKGDAYISLIINKIKPLIDNEYRTKTGRRFTYVAGSSAGGTVSFMLAWNHPEIFSRAFCLSPAFRIQNIDVVSDVQSYIGRKKRIILYIDNGGKGLEERLQPGIDEMLASLREKGFKPGKDYHWVSDPEAEHNEKAWAKRMPGALQLMVGK